MLEHPGKILASTLEQAGLTQRAFAQQLGKKVSEINELIKGKRNITIAWDFLLSKALGTPQQFWMQKQLDYDYEQFLVQHQGKTDSSSPISQTSLSENLATNQKENLSLEFWKSSELSLSWEFSETPNALTLSDIWEFAEISASHNLASQKLSTSSLSSFEPSEVLPDQSSSLRKEALSDSQITSSSDGISSTVEIPAETLSNPSSELKTPSSPPASVPEEFLITKVFEAF